MFFGGEEGFNAFYPKYVKDNPYPPQVVITELTVLNQPLTPGEGSFLDEHISIARQVTLPHDSNVLTFRFAAPHFGHPEQNRYAYRLEPLDQDWIDSGTRRHASYSHLPAGDYEFHVKAANSDGVWNEEGIAVSVNVSPASAADMVGLCGRAPR